MQLFAYSDRSAQALHLSQYLLSNTQLFVPGDIETQPIYMDFELPGTDACLTLEILPLAELGILLQAESQLSVLGLAEGQLQIEVEDESEMSLLLDAEAQQSLVASAEGGLSLELLPETETSLEVGPMAEIETEPVEPEAEPAPETLPEADLTITVLPDASFVLVAEICED
jgi:hypothetical protein